MSPTQRSLKKLRDEGWLVGISSWRVPHCNVTKDLFGFIDMVAMKDGITLAVQTTSGPNVSARIRKILKLASAVEWVKDPAHKIIVHGWRKVGPAGSVKEWDCRVVSLMPI